jgi:hypothetical protein
MISHIKPSIDSDIRKPFTPLTDIKLSQICLPEKPKQWKAKTVSSHSLAQPPLPSNAKHSGQSTVEKSIGSVRKADTLFPIATAAAMEATQKA